jgi:hypothetical protein
MAICISLGLGISYLLSSISDLYLHQLSTQRSIAMDHKMIHIRCSRQMGQVQLIAIGLIDQPVAACEFSIKNVILQI